MNTATETAQSTTTEMTADDTLAVFHEMQERLKRSGFTVYEIYREICETRHCNIVQVANHLKDMGNLGYLEVEHGTNMWSVIE